MIRKAFRDTKKTKLKMSDFKETCIWMSYRYAIGRKSIASLMHAEDIAKHMEWVPIDRWAFTGMEDRKRHV